jgi:hypothetical protein
MWAFLMGGGRKVFMGQYEYNHTRCLDYSSEFATESSLYRAFAVKIASYNYNWFCVWVRRVRCVMRARDSITGLVDGLGTVSNSLPNDTYIAHLGDHTSLNRITAPPHISIYLNDRRVILTIAGSLLKPIDIIILVFPFFARIILQGSYAGPFWEGNGLLETEWPLWHDS